MSALVSAELLKLRTTRTALGFLIAIVVLTLVAQGAGFATSDFSTAQDLREGMAGAGVAATFLLILGIIGTTGEYRHGTITSTLLASPDRRRLVAAKAIAYAITGALLGLAAMLATFAVGAIWLSVRDAPSGCWSGGLPRPRSSGDVVGGALGRGRGGDRSHRPQSGGRGGGHADLPLRARAAGRPDPWKCGRLHDRRRPGRARGAPFGDALDPLPAGLVLAAWALVLGLAGAELEERRDVV